MQTTTRTAGNVIRTAKTGDENITIQRAFPTLAAYLCKGEAGQNVIVREREITADVTIVDTSAEAQAELWARFEALCGE